MIEINKYINKLKVNNKKKDIPVFACVIKDEQIVAYSYNNSYKNKNISGHAEINAINKAVKKLKTNNLSECTLFTTLEPCLMCYGAIKLAKISEVNYLLENNKMSFRNEVNIDEIKLKISKIKNPELEKKYQSLITNFFENIR
ncbi:nucleoside deaminase [Mesoplasma melaleucae]|uniref:tRNA-specific adenosine deaminase n=1 Tax=Mesoplasma melaleucae TaxID=81459 RepID=A0A2K8NX14_9MOLU|nr:nucleoside deaminase [Mesoplasma melaleucae]ATZ18382.1 tRNA-specific adenosine deaminase [Mesoplasma melaleucae]